MGSESYARAVYVIASYMIERHGDCARDVVARFVAANQSEEDVEVKTLWADVRIAVGVLASEARWPPPPRPLCYQ
jgi:hypothetical protein